MKPAERDRWACPFCGADAMLETSPPPLCESRTCSCGAIALAAPSRDYDEITDDAIGLFSVQVRPSSRGNETLLREDIARAGVTICPGAICTRELMPGRHEGETLKALKALYILFFLIKLKTLEAI